MKGDYSFGCSYQEFEQNIKKKKPSFQCQWSYHIKHNCVAQTKLIKSDAHVIYIVALAVDALVNVQFIHISKQKKIATVSLIPPN